MIKIIKYHLEDMTSEDIYYDTINSSEIYKDILDVDDLNHKKIHILKQMLILSIINLN